MTEATRPTTSYPTQPPQVSYYYPNQTRDPHAKSLSPWLTFVAALIFSSLIVLTTIYYFLSPSRPILTLESLSLTSLNLSTSELSAKWTVNFTVTNPNNNLHGYYDQVEVRIFYDSSPLALNQLQPLYQASNSRSSVVAKIVADSAYISPERVQRFEGDRKNGVVRFDVQVLAVARFKRGVWKFRNGLIAVCHDLSVSISTVLSGSLSGGSRRCVAAFTFC